jgi:hypothetical protein
MTRRTIFDGRPRLRQGSRDARVLGDGAAEDHVFGKFFTVTHRYLPFLHATAAKQPPPPCISLDYPGLPWTCLDCGLTLPGLNPDFSLGRGLTSLDLV